MASNVHHMTRKYGGLTGSFAEQLQRFAEDTMDRADEIFREIVMQVGESVIRLTPVDTGDLRGAWRLSIDGYDSSLPETPDKDGSETIARMLADVGALSFGQAAFIQNNLPHAIPNEYGHSSQAPSGMVRITQARFQEIVQQAVREVAQ